MHEILEKAISIDDRASAAKQSQDEAERLIDDFKPFLHARVARYSLKSDEDQREELLSVAMLGFYEAIQNYDIAKGHFFSFADRVVRGRIIDCIRKAYRPTEQTVSLDTDNQNGMPGPLSTALTKISVQSFDADSRQSQLLEEIEQFKRELAAWGITLDALSKKSPKHQKLRKVYQEVILKIQQNVDIMQTIQLKRYFPVNTIAKITELPPKKLERARTFILASLIIKTGDYDYLSDYVQWDRR